MEFGVWSLEFGVWILDFGVWSLEFGFWILDQFSIRSFCGGPKRRRLDFGVWILEFGFWILDFGLDEALPDIVWILHKIFPCHADSGRRIKMDYFGVFYPYFWKHPYHSSIADRVSQGSGVKDPVRSSVGSP